MLTVSSSLPSWKRPVSDVDTGDWGQTFVRNTKLSLRTESGRTDDFLRRPSAGETVGGGMSCVGDGKWNRCVRIVIVVALLELVIGT